MKTLIRTIAAVMTAVMMMSVSVCAASPAGTDKDGNAMYYMTCLEYMQFYQDALKNSGTPALAGSIGTLSIYGAPSKSAVAMYRKEKGMYEVTVKDSNAYSITESSGLLTGGSLGSVATVTGYRGSSTEEQRQMAKAVMDVFGLYSGEYITGRTSVYGLLADGEVVFYPAGLYAAYKCEETFRTIYVPELHRYVADGMTVKMASYAAAQYLADKVTYNHAAYEYYLNRAAYRKAGIPYPGNSDCLGTGTGVCYDYATAYYALMREIPFDINGLVNWESGTRGCVDVRYCESSDHAWNAVLYDGSLHYFDVTWYDNETPGGGNARWLDMGTAEMNDSHHVITEMY